MSDLDILLKVQKATGKSLAVRDRNLPIIGVGANATIGEMGWSLLVVPRENPMGRPINRRKSSVSIERVERDWHALHCHVSHPCAVAHCMDTGTVIELFLWTIVIVLGGFIVHRVRKIGPFKPTVMDLPPQTTQKAPLRDFSADELLHYTGADSSKPIYFSVKVRCSPDGVEVPLVCFAKPASCLLCAWIALLN